MIIIFILTLFLSTNLVINPCFSQAPLQHPKKSYVDSLNRYYQQASLPLYVFFSHSPELLPIKASPEDYPDKKNAIKPIYLDGHGKHLLRHIDEVHRHVDNFVVYADGMAPVSQIFHLDAPFFTRNGKNYFGKGLKIRLQAKDEMSGVEQIYIATAGQSFSPYLHEIPIEKEGEYSFNYYAVDNVGNVENVKKSNFIVDITSPKTYYNVVGLARGYIISTSTKIYLTPTDSLSGVAKTFYKFDDEPERLYTGGMLNFSYLNDGEHKLYWYSIDNVQNKENVQTFEFYLDKTAPIMSADVLGDKFIANDRVYFSGRTKLKLTAVDNKAGIKEVRYSIDNGEFMQYTEPFYLPSKSGLHIIRYYALDNMQNEGAGIRDAKYDEYKHNVSAVYVDLTGPSLNHVYIGPKFQKGDTIFINSQTKIQLLAEDPESGLQKITYKIDGQGDEVLYTTSFSLSEAGRHVIDYFGYDNVNNRNVGRFEFIVDNDPPEIYYHFSIKPLREQEGIPVYPAYASLYLAATDWMVGGQHIRYSINGSKEQIYNGIIFGFEKGRKYQIKIYSTDKLGNTATREIEFLTETF
ncbi:MAG: hypothetical protein RML72_09695 [Bacteroidia bacterium]|nr:hypothetical protein [Bacteroidia bacterium]MDW8159129.1 hypothetical protein [Bacteroidia bacterium]